MQCLHFLASIKVLFLRETLINISETCEFKSIRLKKIIPRTLVIRANERLTNTYLVRKTYELYISYYSSSDEIK